MKTSLLTGQQDSDYNDHLKHTQKKTVPPSQHPHSPRKLYAQPQVSERQLLLYTQGQPKTELRDNQVEGLLTFLPTF